MWGLGVQKGAAENKAGRERWEEQQSSLGGGNSGEEKKRSPGRVGVVGGWGEPLAGCVWWWWGDGESRWQGGCGVVGLCVWTCAHTPVLHACMHKSRGVHEGVRVYKDAHYLD